MTITIIGLGLIGGSLALSLRLHGLAGRLIGVEADVAYARRAMELGLVDELAPDLPTAVSRSGADLIIVAVPMDALLTVLPQVFNLITNKQVVLDVGSTKAQLLAAVAAHPRRGRFVATHPMTGTEFSGPDAAVRGLFEGKTVVLCETEASDPDALDLVETLLRALPMRVLHLGAAEHDLHVAYVSHLAHLTSFALALTVLEKERGGEPRIFDLAGGGFASAVRLAKSAPATWVPIFRQNRANLLDVLDEHLHQLHTLRALLADEDYEGLTDALRQANEIQKIIP